MPSFQIMPVGERVVRIDQLSGETWVLDINTPPYIWTKAEDPLTNKPDLSIPQGLSSLGGKLHG